MKVALVHDWLTGMRGGEKCLEVFCELFPDAHLYTLLYIPGTVSPAIAGMDIRTSRLQRLPFSRKHYRYYLPLMPSIVDGWRPERVEYDLVLSSSHCVAKGLQFPNRKRHVCYCFTPMRYLWCQGDQYFRGNWKQTALGLIRESLRKWDLKVNSGVDDFIGISDNVSNRIRDFYRRDATTIYPPVDTEFYTPDPSIPREDFLLVAGALEPYKRVDLAIDALSGNPGQKLKIVGKGTMLEPLRKRAAAGGHNVGFLDWRPDEEIRELYRRARGLIFPGEEDFGIVPLEAQACGCPVLAYRAGGCLETILEGTSGAFFPVQTPESLSEALTEFMKKNWSPTLLRLHAEKFNRARFKEEMRTFLTSKSGLTSPGS
jgi:glycosyltransferase involved in cell wall biosynthesis